MSGVDVNTRDHGYPHVFKKAKPSPLPLLLAVWETGCHDAVKIMLEKGADSSVLFSFDKRRGPEKPLYFHVRFTLCLLYYDLGNFSHFCVKARLTP